MINTDPGENLGYAARKGDEDKFLSSLTRSLSYCASLSCPRLHIMSGRKVEGVAQEEVMVVLEKNLLTARPLLEKAGVIGLIEPINPWSVPCYNMDSFTEALNIVK